MSMHSRRIHIQLKLEMIKRSVEQKEIYPYPNKVMNLYEFASRYFRGWNCWYRHWISGPTNYIFWSNGFALNSIQCGRDCLRLYPWSMSSNEFHHLNQGHFTIGNFNWRSIFNLNLNLDPLIWDKTGSRNCHRSQNSFLLGKEASQFFLFLFMSRILKNQKGVFFVKCVMYLWM